MFFCVVFLCRACSPNREPIGVLTFHSPNREPIGVLTFHIRIGPWDPKNPQILMNNSYVFLCACFCVVHVFLFGVTLV